MALHDEEIRGLQVTKLIKHRDDRGSLVETFRIDSLPDGLRPEMAYVSFTEPGNMRGPHEHREQTDIFSFIGPGNFKIYLWDNRVDSNTYGNSVVIFGGQDNPITIIVPPGIVHGYKNISKTEKGMVLNYPNKLYAGWNRKKSVDEIRHEDEKDKFYKDFLKS